MNIRNANATVRLSTANLGVGLRRATGGKTNPGGEVEDGAAEGRGKAEPGAT